MNPLNIIRTVVAAASVIVVGITIKEHSQVVKTERAKREEIRLQMERDLLAVRRSALIVQEKIQNGDYDRNLGAVIPAIMSDMKFYQITDRFAD